ncbi:MAG TPA: hypothetical protein VJN88_13425, partial [Ktedonobacterales bacterium]|nr:hypothetical protein [Ktedonobacterales bacterium]
MATMPSSSQPTSRRSRTPRHHVVRATSGMRHALSTLWEFWQKANNDWIFNLAAMLAYNFLVSIIPVGLLLLAIAGYFVGDIRPGGATGLQQSIASVFPNQLGVPLLNAVAQHLRSSAPVF